ncbi:MAG TPA: ABC transporter ATP-binding protein [Terriglobales bacterium]|nr:ABC transporter ATP-binding protein [Terriglobales bacterium]
MSKGALELRQVVRTYAKIPVVRGISFTLRPGEVCGYLGPNGSGKTTTVRMLTGLLPPTSGGIYFDGSDIAEAPMAYKARFGYVPEEPYLYRHLTGQEYLELVGGLRGIPDRPLRAKIHGALEIFGLLGSRDAAIESYSKGMKQKILISAALLHDPELLILDEPLSGLDVTAVAIVRHLFAALARRGKIVLYSSHVLEVVERICSRVIVLYQGRVVADDSVSRLGEMMKLPSLEAIFARLTEQPDLERQAQDLVELMAG